MNISNLLLLYMYKMKYVLSTFFFVLSPSSFLYISSPAGFDCMYANSCPCMTVDCPTGFYCNSYSNSPYETEIDIKYAEWKLRLSRTTAITKDNRLDYIEPQRIVTVECPSGYYCPNSTSIYPCESGSTCPEGSLKPITCDNLSYCPDVAAYQLNFVNILIAVLATVFVTILTYRQYYRQHQAENRSRSNQPSNNNSVIAVKPAAVNDPSSSISPTKIPVGLSFQFRDITVIVPGHPHNARNKGNSGNIEIVSHVSGTINAGKFCALMGPTACGKSTLLNILQSGGKLASSGQVQVLAHYRHDNPSGTHTTEIIQGNELARRIGFVPQEDILDRSLTVRELFTFNAKARLPYSTSTEHINQVVYNTLSDLGLLGCADTIIGGGANAAANISGGQLKRVNIGCELVALQRPAALLLDEPTSGLDASIANEVCETLAKLTAQGITVCMILQQPRPEIFQRFQHILFMQHGRIVYEGESNEAASYFTKLGFPQPNDASDADFCIDVLTGIVSRQSSSNNINNLSNLTKQQNKRFILAEAWKIQSEAQKKDNPNATKDSELSFASGINPLWYANDKNNTSSAIAVTNLSQSSFSTNWKTELTSFMYLIYLNAQRGLITRLRNIRNLLIYGGLHMIMAVSLSVGFTVFIQQTYRNTLDIPVRENLVPFCPSVLKEFCANHNQLDLGFAQLLFFISTAVGCAAALSAIPLFGGQMELVKREVSNGLSSIAYSYGRMITDSLLVFLNGLIFAGVWLLFGHAGHYYTWLGVILPTAYATAGIGYTAAVITRPVNAAVIAIITITAFAVFSGVEPTLTSVKGYYVLNWIWYLSFSTYSAEGTYYTWVQSFRDNPDAWKRVVKGADYFGYDIDSQSRSIGALIALGLTWRLIAVFILYVKTKPKTYAKQ